GNSVQNIVSAFGPVAFSLGLLLVLPAAFPAPVLPGEDSKDVAAPHSQPLTSSERIDKHIRYILDGISALRKETCNRSNMCESSKEALAENNLNLPKMAEKDGCFQSGFNEETCLVKIITGLLEFEVYLEYLQNRFESSEEQARAVQMSTKVLIQFLQKKAKNLDAITTPEPTTNASLLTKLQAQNQWLQDMTTHLILRSFKEFLQSSLRALRQM
uniref:Interleukin-6 n=1 Tax=Colobus angolensis palliatus TaxID=336983 RepID=A0A2K5KAQ8_COLAP